jgi:hypothetical protein
MRATPGCEAAGTAYNDSVPQDSVPPANDLCPIHPAKAVPVDPGDLASTEVPRARAVEDVPKALPVDEELGPIKDEVEIPLKAIPVEDE